jgi:hypothetical protein
MATKHTTHIPMVPEDRPGQWINEVVGLPERPEGLEVEIALDRFISCGYPKGTPRKLTFVCSVEWAWSPAHNRINNYYLNPKRKHCFLWNNWVDDGGTWSTWTWHWDVLACTPALKADERTIAAHMLMDFWKKDAIYNDLDRYHWINNSGCLSVEDIQTVAREVW